MSAPFEGTVSGGGYRKKGKGRSNGRKERNIYTIEKGKNKERTDKGSERKAAILNMKKWQTRAFLVQSVPGIFHISWVTSKPIFNRLD